MGRRLTLWLIIFLTTFSLFVNLPNLPLDITIPKTKIKISQLLNKFPLHFGLDLQGGTEIVLLADTSKYPNEQKDTALESAKDVIEKRVNLYGVSEAVVQTSRLGDQRRIIVELPGVQDASSAAQLIGKTAELEFREQSATPSAEATSSAVAFIRSFNPTGLTGADLKKAQVTFNTTRNQNSGPQVALEFNSEGAKKFADITKRNIGKPLGIFLDGQLIEAPSVSQEIIGGNAVITGQFNVEQAKSLVIQLNAGALPVPVRIINQQTIGASLGQESINKSIAAGVIGIFLVMVYMVFYYGFYGFLADIALIIYTLLNLAIYRTGLFLLPPITLTLAGIAGFILSIGMAVDANILIFERMKEERRLGQSKKSALNLGFNRAWSSIRDSNISSLITASILYFLGTGVVRGFAVTLSIGVLVSMFTAVLVTRTLLRLFIKD